MRFSGARARAAAAPTQPSPEDPIAPHHAAWRREFVRRLRIHTVAKMLATLLGISAFFFAYFWVLRHPFRPPVLMPVTALDRLVGFEPAFLPLYFSLWFYVSIAPALLASGRELAGYGAATFAISVIGFGVFMLWPTAAPPFAPVGPVPGGMQFLKDVDLAANACPSLHVAFAVFTALWLARLLLEMRSGWALHVLSALWCVGILYSTLATRQHVLLDVLAGAALGAAVAAVHMRMLGTAPAAPAAPAAPDELSAAASRGPSRA